jgi:hypothetical protein
MHEFPFHFNPTWAKLGQKEKEAGMGSGTVDESYKSISGQEDSYTKARIKVRMRQPGMFKGR